MTDRKRAEEVLLRGVRAINVSYYDTQTKLLLLHAMTSNGKVALRLSGIDHDLAKNLLNALAAPTTPIYDGGRVGTRFGDWAIAETIIDKLTDE